MLESGIPLPRQGVTNKLILPATASSVSDMLRIGIVSEVRLYRETLAATLARHEAFVVVWTAAGLDAALDAARRGGVGGIIVDMATHDALPIVRSLRQIAPDVHIVAFASNEVDEDIIACAEAGVAGFVPAEATIEDVSATLVAAAHGEARCSPRTTAVLLRLAAGAAVTGPAATKLLTWREREILGLIERGMSNKDIARLLHIQVATVKNHVHNVLEKLGVGSRGEAAAKHRAAGFPRPGAARSETMHR